MIEKHAENYRRFVDASAGNSTKGAGFGEHGTSRVTLSDQIFAYYFEGELVPGDESVLATVLQEGEYLELTADQHRRFVTEPSLIEQLVSCSREIMPVLTCLSGTRQSTLGMPRYRQS